MKTIGLTGGIGSGKSTVAKLFKALDVPVFIADTEAKWLMANDGQLKKEIKKLLGESAYKNGELDSKYIASVVFKDSDKLDGLNAIVHPKVHEHFKKWLAEQTADYVIYEAAIIFESGRQDEFDKIILVTLDKAIRIERLLKRDDTTKEAIESRMDNQWPESKKIPLADFIIKNDSYVKTEKKVEIIHKKIINSQ